MNKKSLRVLEFDKIIELLSQYAVNEITRERIAQVAPLTDFVEVSAMQAETDEALVCLLKFGSPEIQRINPVATSLKRIEVGGALSTLELLNVAKVLKCARILQKYGENAVGANCVRPNDETIHLRANTVRPYKGTCYPATLPRFFLKNQPKTQ